MKKFLYSIIFITLRFSAAYGQISLIASGGTPAANYSTLKNAFDAINLGTHQGIISMQISGSIIETATAKLNASGSGSSSYNSIQIQPAPNNNASITGNINGKLIELNGSDNVTITGINTPGNSLTIENTYIGTSFSNCTIFIGNDASNNIITKSIIKGSCQGSGIIYISNGVITGNDSNIISECLITNSVGTHYKYGIWAVSNTGKENSNNIFSNNSINNATWGIYLSGNNYDGIITGNKLYQSNNRTATSSTNDFGGIYIYKGEGHQVTNNIIGSASPNLSGYTEITASSSVSYTGIFINSTLNSKTEIDDNTIAKVLIISTSGTATINGFKLFNGKFNLGTNGGNFIGEIGSDSSLVVRGVGMYIRGVDLSGAYKTEISFNSIGGLLASPFTSNDHGAINGVWVTNQKDSLSIHDNVIGNTNIPSSIRIGNYYLSGRSSECMGIKISSTSPSNNNTFLCHIYLNTIQNMECYGPHELEEINGIYYTDTHELAEGSIIIRENIIKNLRTNNSYYNPVINSGHVVAAGIQVTKTKRPSEVEGNKISELYALRDGQIPTIITGILIDYASNSSIHRNNIHSIYNSAQSTNTNLEPYVTGVFVYGIVSQISVANNMISLNGVGDKKIIGIQYHQVSSDNSIQFYHNTVNIFGNNATGALPSFCFLVSCNSALTNLNSFTIINNIFNNSRTGGTGYHYAIGSNSPILEFYEGKWQAGVSNFNLLNANPNTIGFYLGPHTFSSWKNVFSNDIKSYTGITLNFVNMQIADLHINTVGPTLLESGGIVLPNLTTDFDGNSRPGPVGSINGGSTSPDIGADEFDGVPPPSMIYLSSITEQITGTAFIGKSNQAIIRVKITTQNRYLPLNLTTFVLNALGTTDFNEINSGTARIYYTAGSTLFDTTYLFGIAQPSLSNFTISGNQILEEGDNYFWLTFDISTIATEGNLIDAQCMQVAINNTFVPIVTNPSDSKVVRGPMKGTYYIGEGLTVPNFPNLTTALNELNNRGVFGAVQFELTDTLYSFNEVFPLTIEEVPGVSSMHTVTITPSLNNKAKIRGNSTNESALIKLEGSDFITIDGSNGPNSSLSFENTSFNQSSAVIWLLSMGNGQGATNNRIKNCSISAGLPITLSSGKSYGIISSGNNLKRFTNQITPGYDNHSNQFSNNRIVKVSYGICILGGDINNLSKDIVINENQIGPSVFSDSLIGDCGILISYVENIVVSENRIQFVGADFKSIKSSYARIGISLSHSADNSPSKTRIKGAKIFNNTISNVVDEKQNSAYGIQILSWTSPTPSNIVVSNNSISNIKSNNNSSNLNAGIAYFGGKFDTIAFNSIHLFGDADPDPTTYTTGTGRYGMFLGVQHSVDTFNVVIANNNVVNEIFSSSTANINTACIGINGPYIWQSGFLNYNNYYVDPLKSNSFIGRVESTQQGIPLHQAITLQNWNTITNQDYNSRSVKPIFYNPYNLHLKIDSNSYINNRGIALMGMQKDIDNEIRNATNPDIGIDEYTPPGCSSQPEQGVFTSPIDSICSGNTYILNPLGLTQELGVIYQWKSGPTGGPYQTVTSGTGATSPNYITPQLPAGVYHYIIESTCVNTGQTNQSGEFKLIVNQKPSITLTPAGNNNLCGNEIMHFEVFSDIANSYEWKKNGYIIPGETLNYYNTSVPGSYRAIVTVFPSMCQDSSTSVIEDIIPAPDPIILNIPYLDICHDTILPLIATGGNVVQDETYGDDVLSNTETTPYNGIWGGNKVQYIINASELSNSGLTQFDTITDISLNIIDFQGPYLFQNLSIGLKNSNLNELSLTFESGFTTVLDPINFTINTNGPQPVSHKFDHPFQWDGISNLIIEYCFNNNNSGGASINSANIESSLSNFPNSTHYYSANNSAQLCSENSGGTLSNLRPNVTLKFKKHLSKTWSPIVGLYCDSMTSIPYTGTDNDTVYAKVTSSIIYKVSTNNFSCFSEDSSFINITHNEVVNQNNSGPGSLRRAIECSENNDTVHISLPTILEIELLSNIIIDKQISIIDNLGTPVKLIYNYQSMYLQNEYNGSFRITENGSLQIENLEIQQNGETNIHPCIVNKGELIIKNCIVRSLLGNTLPVLILNIEGGELKLEGFNTFK